MEVVTIHDTESSNLNKYLLFTGGSLAFLWMALYTIACGTEIIIRLLDGTSYSNNLIAHPIAGWIAALLGVTLAYHLSSTIRDQLSLILEKVRENKPFHITAGIVGISLVVLGFVSGFYLISLTEAGEALGVFLIIHPIIAILSIFVLALACYLLLEPYVPNHYYYYLLAIGTIVETIFLLLRGFY